MVDARAGNQGRECTSAETARGHENLVIPVAAGHVVACFMLDHGGQTQQGLIVDGGSANFVVEAGTLS